MNERVEPTTSHSRLPANSANVATGASLAALLAILVAVGLHARLPSPALESHSKGYEEAVVGTLLLVAIALLVLTRMRVSRAARDRSGTGSVVPERLRVILTWVLGIAAAALVITFISLLAGVHLRLKQRLVSGGAPIHVVRRPGHPSASKPSSFHAPYGQALWLVLVVLIAGVAVALLFRERHRRPVVVIDPLPDVEDFHAWHETLVGGQRALLEVDDTRAAIIACYAAMAEGLAKAGTELSVADTPDELLARVGGALTVSAAAARRLTDLFYEARFSTHPMDDTDKNDARDALDELVSYLASLDGDIAQPLVDASGVGQ